MSGVFGSNVRTRGWRLAFLAAAGSVVSLQGIQGEEMTTPLTFDVYDGEGFSSTSSTSSTCNGAPTEQGTTTYLAPLPQRGSLCENSITAVDSGDGNGTMVDTTIYTKITIVSCDDFPATGHVLMDVYLCDDAQCGDCDSVPIPAQLIVPTYTVSSSVSGDESGDDITILTMPSIDYCWGISSAVAQLTSYQRFVATADPEAVRTYWKIFADHSCIGETMNSAATSATTTTTTVAIIILSSIVAATVVFV